MRLLIYATVTSTILEGGDIWQCKVGACVPWVVQERMAVYLIS